MKIQGIEVTDGMIDDVCLHMRHDFGLMNPAGRDIVRMEAKDALAAWAKVLPIMDMREVFVVSGDFANVGGGEVLGVYDDADLAAKNAIGCGSCDCGGDGNVVKGMGIFRNGKVYLLRDTMAYTLNEALPSFAKQHHSQEVQKHPVLTNMQFEQVCQMIQRDKVGAIKLVRVFTGRGLFECKKIVDELS